MSRVRFVTKIAAPLLILVAASAGIGFLLPLWPRASLLAQEEDGLVFSTDKDGKPAEGHFSEAALPKEKEAAFLKSIFDNLPLERLDESFVSIDKTGSVSLWRAVEPSITTRVNRAVLRFKKAPGQGRDSKDVDGFDISMDFFPDRLEIRHSLSKRTGHDSVEARVYYPWRDPQRKELIRGLGNSSVVAVILQAGREEDSQTGVFLCPRKDYDLKGKQGGMTFFIDSNYRVMRGMFGVSASISGSAPPNTGRALLQTSFLTTPNISRAMDFFKEISGDGVQVDTNYTPFAAEQIVTEDRTGDMVGAIKTTFNAYLEDGRKRFSTLKDIVWVKEVYIGKERTWGVQMGDRLTPVSPGYCYIVLRESFNEHRFEGLAPTPTAPPALTPGAAVSSADALSNAAPAVEPPPAVLSTPAGTQ